MNINDNKRNRERLIVTMPEHPPGKLSFEDESLIFWLSMIIINT